MDVLVLNVTNGLVDLCGDIGNLDPAERLDDPQQVLLEQCVVQRREVVADDGIVRQFCASLVSRGVGGGGLGRTMLVFAESSLKRGETAVLVCLGDGAHRLDVLAGVLLRQLALHDGRDVLGQAEHDLAQEHVLERRHRLGVVLARQALERLKEVRVPAVWAYQYKPQRTAEGRARPVL